MYIGILSSAKFVKDAIVSVDFEKDALHFGVPKSSLILSSANLSNIGWLYMQV